MCSKPIKMSYTFTGKVIVSGICIDNSRFLNQFAALEAKLQNGNSPFAVRDLIRAAKTAASNLIVVSFK